MRTIVTLALATLTMSAVPAAGQAPRAEVPIRAITLSDGVRRYAVPVTVDGAAVEAGLDTGSTGLRVLARAVPAMAAEKGGGAGAYRYSSGVSLDGRVLREPVALGGGAALPVPIERIDKVGCTPDHRGCPGERLAIADYGLQGDGLKGEGFPAILGLNMADDPVKNPLVAMGVTRWIVELPRPGDAGDGRLILNPSDGEIAGYTLYPLIAAFANLHGGLHDALHGCLVRADGGEKLCGPVLFDSGAPGLRVSLKSVRAVWPRGAAGQLVVGGGGKPSALAFTVGLREQASAMTIEQPATGAERISAGLMPYFGWSVLYDAKAGAIGLKPR